MGCGSGCGCGPPDPVQGSRESWRAILFLMAIGGVLFVMASR
jgi:hypothetical protein